MGCLAASLVFIHWVPGESFPSWDNQNVSRPLQMFPSGQNGPLLRVIPLNCIGGGFVDNRNRDEISPRYVQQTPPVFRVTSGGTGGV